MRPAWIAATWTGAVLLGVGGAQLQHHGRVRQVIFDISNHDPTFTVPTFINDPPCSYVHPKRQADFQTADEEMRRSQCWEPM